jgi:hypothetical protein
MGKIQFYLEALVWKCALVVTTMVAVAAVVANTLSP